MDDETREAMDMSPEELAARWAKGERAAVRKTEDFIQRMKRVSDSTIAKSEANEQPILRIVSTIESRARHVTLAKHQVTQL
jgi:hypothetical protein